MKKVAFTIVLNGLRHLQHNNFFETMEKAFDIWVIVEGAAKNTGSTKWCKAIPRKYHTDDYLSTDGTTEFLREKAPGDTHVFHIEYGGHNKDEMVRRAMDEIDEHTHLTRDCYVFEIDVDEQWTEKQMNEAIAHLEYMNADCGQFLCNYYVGKNLVARGEWGEGRREPYRRLWRCRPGMRFVTHEPPELDGGNGVTALLPQRFNHYAYYFDEDVRFKNDFYGGHEGIYEKWLAMQKETKFPQPLTKLISGPWGKTNTIIERVSV